MRKVFKRVLALCIVFMGCMIPLQAGLAAGPVTASSTCHIGSEYYDTIAEAVTAAANGDTISVTKDSVLTAVIPISKAITISGETSGLKISRSTAIQMFSLNGTSASLTLENITLDGGAIWSDGTPNAANAKTRTNSGLVAGRQSIIFADNGATIELKSGAILQNAHAVLTTDNAFGAAIETWNGTILNMYDGAIIQNNSGNCPAGGNFAGGVCINERAVFNMYGGVIRGCAALDTDSNSGAAVFARSNSMASACTFNMYGTSQITDNYNGSAAAVTVRASYFNMHDTTSIDHNVGGYGGGALTYTNAQMRMNDHSTMHHNSAINGGGLYLSSNSGDATAYSMLDMLDDSTISNNTASQAGGGAYINAGAVEMMNNSKISENSALAGGGLCLPKFTGTGREIANLIGGKIVNNTATSLGSAIYFGGTSLNLNASSFEIDNTIYLTGDGTNANAKVVSLVGTPSKYHYILSTKLAGDTFLGRDVVRPGSVIVREATYSTSDDASFAGFFTHTSMYITKGAEYYGALSDTTHDRFLVLNDIAPAPTPVVDDPVPKTGDSNHLTGLYLLLGVSVMLFGVSIVVMKKKNARQSEICEK